MASINSIAAISTSCFETQAQGKGRREDQRRERGKEGKRERGKEGKRGETSSEEVITEEVPFWIDLILPTSHTCSLLLTQTDSPCGFI